MPRAETPPDNEAIAALNGWMKEESFLGFGLATPKDIAYAIRHGAMGLHLNKSENLDEKLCNDLLASVSSMVNPQKPYICKLKKADLLTERVET